MVPGIRGGVPRAYPLYGSKYFEPSTIYDFKGRVATIDVMARRVVATGTQRVTLRLADDLVAVPS